MATRSFKAWVGSEGGIYAVSFAFLGVAALESSILPWAPYFFILMAGGLAIPLWLRSYRLGAFKNAFRGHLTVILAVWAASVFLDQAMTGFFAERIWGILGKAGDPFFSVSAFIERLLSGVAARTGLPLGGAQAAFLLVALGWAPIGEELFYRGYVFGGLRDKRGFWAASIASAFFFGFRHALPFLYLLPDAHWIPCLIWGAMGFGYGLLNNFLYERTGSLWPGIIGHFVVNAISMLLM